MPDATARAARLLAARTRRLARRSAPPAPAGRPLLLCLAGTACFGLPLEAVARVLPVSPWAALPGAPPALLGLLGRDGQLYSLLDLALALGLGQAAAAEGGHLLLLRQAPRRFALRVDRALGVAAPPALEAPGRAADAPITGHAPVPPGMLPSDPEQPRLAGLVDLDRLLQPFLASSAPSGSLTP